MIKLAVLLPVCNKDKDNFLITAIDSLIFQSFKEFDIYLLIDGPVNDKLKEVINSYNMPNFYNISFDVNRGLPAVLNSGLSICIEKGYEFISRMDADDIAHPERIKKQLKYLVEHPEVDVVGTQSFLIDDNDKIIGTKYVKLTTNFRQLLKRIDVIHPSVMFRREFFEKYGYYDQYYRNSQDMDLWLRATKKGAIIHNINEKLYYLRFDKNVIKRRKEGQYYRIKIKKQHLSGFKYLYSIIPNIIVVICPASILRFILKIKSNRNS